MPRIAMSPQLGQGREHGAGGCWRCRLCCKMRRSRAGRCTPTNTSVARTRLPTIASQPLADPLFQSGQDGLARLRDLVLRARAHAARARPHHCACLSGTSMAGGGAIVWKTASSDALTRPCARSARNETGRCVQAVVAYSRRAPMPRAARVPETRFVKSPAFESQHYARGHLSMQHGTVKWFNDAKGLRLHLAWGWQRRTCSCISPRSSTRASRGLQEGQRVRL